MNISSSQPLNRDTAVRNIDNDNSNKPTSKLRKQYFDLVCQNKL